MPRHLPNSLFAALLLPALLALLLAAPSVAQAGAPPAAPANPGFETGEPGGAPDGWRFAGLTGATVTLDAEAPFAGRLSACIDSREAADERGRISNLMQSLDATAWRGERVRFRAAVRTDPDSSAAHTQLWMRIDGPGQNGSRPTRAFDNMAGRAIRSVAWQHFEIVLDVADDAERILLGMFVTERDRAWIDDVSFAAVDASVAPTAALPRPAPDPLPPLVRKALVEAEQAPQQPFLTPWLLPAALVVLLLMLAGTPVRGVADGAAPGDAASPAPGNLRRFALRFATVYWLLYATSRFVGGLRLGHLHPHLAGAAGQVQAFHLDAEAALAGWLARGVFAIDDALVPPNGSGDTTQSYLTVLGITVLALAAATIWHLLRRGTLRGHAIQADLLRSFLRYTLAFTMLGYGLAKASLLGNQFPTLGEHHLSTTWGDSSPMGVLWKFMGTSRPYTIFAGLGELLAAVLLIWRRTATLGALVTIAVMVNVAMLNLCYDVPVKLLSTHLLLMALAVALADAPRLLKVFVLDRATARYEGVDAFGVWRPLWWLRIPLKATVLWTGIACPMYGHAESHFENWDELPSLGSTPVPDSPHAGSHSVPPPRLVGRGFRWINEVPFNR